MLVWLPAILLDCFVRPVEVQSRQMLGKGLFMIFKYEMICREAGMTEEQIHEIYNMFNAAYQKKYREKKARENSPLEFLSLEAMVDTQENRNGFDIPDTSVDVEAEIIHKMELERLNEVLAMLTEEDREFILDYFSGEGAFLNDLAEHYGITRNQAIARKRAILKLLRELY